MWLEILTILFIVIYFYWDFLFGSRPKKYPPGPIRLPLVGHLPLLGKDPLDTLSKWKSKYGNIIGLRFGDFNVVLFNGYDLIKEAFEKPEFSGRPALGPLMLIAGGKKRGLLVSEGHEWSEQRRFALRNLRDFGFGKKSMEGTIHEDVTEFIKTLSKEVNTPVSTHRRLSLVVLCSLWNIVAGEKMSQDDPKFKSILDNINAVISTTSVSGPLFFMTWIAKLAPNLSGWTAFCKAIAKAKTTIGRIINKHKETFDGENLRDFMDIYLNEIHKTTDPNSSFYKENGDAHMLVAMLNLFAAGAETTSNTLNWALFYLAQNTNAQRKLQRELDTVVGQSRLPSVEDRSQLIYTEAVMLEVFRNSSIVPFGVFHSAMEDVTFHGYNIPKDTVIMGNLWEVHHDKEVWGDPENFRPERFLSKDEKAIEKVGNVIPFSVGKRACLGETLARTEFFLFLTSIFQRFQVSLDPDTDFDVEAVPSLFRFPPPFKVIFKDRQECSFKGSDIFNLNV